MESIYSVGGTLDLIITIPDDHARKKSGRIYVDSFAHSNSIPVVKTRHINDDAAIAAIKERSIDWLFIIGWSQIASKDVIEAPTMGAIGAHPTLLPVGRGRAAIPWAIIKGLDKTGVTFFKMDEGVDTGLILGQEEIPIDSDETATTLYTKVNRAHAILLKRLYQELVHGEVQGVPQDAANATNWPGRKPSDGEIRSTFTMVEVDRLVRATTRPYPGAFWINNNQKTILWAGYTSPTRRDLPDVVEIALTDGFFYGTEYHVEKLQTRSTSE